MQRLTCSFSGLVIVLVSAVPAQAQWESRGEVGRAAGFVTKRADQLYRVMYNYPGFNHLTEDARWFAEAAEQFQRSVQQGMWQQHAEIDYQALERKFSHLRRTFRDANYVNHDPRVVASWRRLEAAFQQLDQAMNLPRHYNWFSPNDR